MNKDVTRIEKNVIEMIKNVINLVVPEIEIAELINPRKESTDKLNIDVIIKLEIVVS